MPPAGVSVKCSSRIVGASTTGTTVWVTNTTGATRMAGRDCSELISLSIPTPEAAAVESPQATAATSAPLKRSSEASFVATPLQPKASPAQMIVMSGQLRPKGFRR